MKKSDIKIEIGREFVIENKTFITTEGVDDNERNICDQCDALDSKYCIKLQCMVMDQPLLIYKEKK